LTAGICLARAGWQTTILEANPVIGGGTQSAELTQPGFVHDVCSAVHPLAAGSPVLASFPLEQHGLQWIQPPLALAHPLDNAPAATLERSLDLTVSGLGRDGSRYRRVVAPLLTRWPELTRDILAPVHFPSSPFLLGRFGALAVWPAEHLARLLFEGDSARALFAGLAGHSMMPLNAPGSAAIGWVLALAAHAVGWPIPRGGSQFIANALASYFESLGGRIVTDTRVRSLAEVQDAGAVVCDVTPRQFLEIAGGRLKTLFRRKMEQYRYGPGAFKIDWALNGPLPWNDPACARAGTVHLGGTLPEVAASERAIAQGHICDRPFVLLAQPSLFDSTRAPTGKHTAWAYCHVPHASTVDMTERIESQIERFAGGFRSGILARSVLSPRQLEDHNANLVGGDISGGELTLGKLLLRPTRLLYRTSLPRVYLCSSSTPPGPGVHGMCGYYAARCALEDAGEAAV